LGQDLKDSGVLVIGRGGVGFVVCANASIGVATSTAVMRLHLNRQLELSLISLLSA